MGARSTGHPEAMVNTRAFALAATAADGGVKLSATHDAGRLVLEGKAADLLQDEGLRKAYLGR